MKEISIPLPDFMDKQIAEIEVKINGKESLISRWNLLDGNRKTKYSRLMKRLKSFNTNSKIYDKSWKLIQIFKPKPDSKFI